MRILGFSVTTLEKNLKLLYETRHCLCCWGITSPPPPPAKNKGGILHWSLFLHNTLGTWTAYLHYNFWDKFPRLFKQSSTVCGHKLGSDIKHIFHLNVHEHCAFTSIVHRSTIKSTCGEGVSLTSFVIQWLVQIDASIGAIYYKPEYKNYLKSCYNDNYD